MTLEKGIICLLVAMTCYYVHPEFPAFAKQETDYKDEILEHGRALQDFWSGSFEEDIDPTQGGMAQAGKIVNATEAMKPGQTSVYSRPSDLPKIEKFFDNIVNFPEKSAMYEGTWLVDDIEDHEANQLLRLAFGELITGTDGKHIPPKGRVRAFFKQINLDFSTLFNSPSSPRL